jgi:hypothetical protein
MVMRPTAKGSSRPVAGIDDRPLLALQISWRVSLPPRDALPAAR